jgi:hypothetical protein
MKEDHVSTAAILAAAIGCFAFGVLTQLSFHWGGIKGALTWYAASGSLSGTGGFAGLAWLAAWGGLHAWARRARPALLSRFGLGGSAVLTAAAFVLTFPW